ncbi:MAG: 5'/3'-nucleotidase SurE [Armatimonadota bacterium]|nr:5'/3'-nucleotidase SurE [Armatimonadota bacterium]MDW8155151.1 5'/3'-nucleotidase SurE [Armatimonadota bacterium]
MRILVTNDDGIEAEGLHALVRACERVGEVTVVAPHHDRSASGHSITLHKPLRVQPARIPGARAEAWAATGTPADCVLLAVYGLLPARPDVVLCGINLGPNIGHDLTYSGTVSGAMEAAVLGIPAIAVSLDAEADPQYEVAASFAAALAEQVCRRGMPPDALLNVNVPNLDASRIRGVQVTRQSGRRYRSRLERRTDPRGRPYYWIAGERTSPEDAEPGTDSHALSHGFVSVTPLQMDLTHPALLSALVGWELDGLLPRR